MSLSNPEIARLLTRYATLLEIDRANPFRVRAYRNAARTIENLPRPLADMLAEGEDLSELPGIGKDLAEKLAEIVDTGNFAELSALASRIPEALADIAELPGLGPKRVKQLYETLKIRSMADLAAAARAGKLQRIQGFGPKLAETVRKAIESRASGGGRIGLFAVEQIASPLLAYLKSKREIGKVALAGSYRRRRETVGDLDIVATARDGRKAIAVFVAYEDVDEVQSKGTTRATVILKSGLQVDFRVVEDKSYGAALIYFTGSKAHGIALRLIAVKRDLKINEYGVFRGERMIAGRREAEVYDAVGLPFIEPELREDAGELDAARSGKLPKLVTLKNIRGDLHCHSRASDGTATLEEMANAAAERGYDYLAISDHTKHLGITHGLDARQLARQMKTIDRLNGRRLGIRLLTSAEVDILPDGKLALDDAILDDLDLVTAAVHTKFELTAKEQTERIIRAMDHPCVNIIAHPTGRLIGEREPYAVDMAKVIAAAKERGCHLEVNGQPSRLDLNDSHCRMAKEMGIKLALSTDAHSPETLDYMRFAVDQARRGWLEPADVLNTHGWAQLKKLLER